MWIQFDLAFEIRVFKVTKQDPELRDSKFTICFAANQKNQTLIWFVISFNPKTRLSKKYILKEKTFWRSVKSISQRACLLHSALFTNVFSPIYLSYWMHFCDVVQCHKST